MRNVQKALDITFCIKHSVTVNVIAVHLKIFNNVIGTNNTYNNKNKINKLPKIFLLLFINMLTKRINVHFHVRTRFVLITYYIISIIY